MGIEAIKEVIEDMFRKQVQKDSKVRNAYLLVHSHKLDFHMNIAEGSTGDMPANSLLIGLLINLDSTSSLE